MITPINVKTIHSKHSSLNTIESIVSLADYLGYTALGICDYNFNGANEFFKQTITNEIKPIFSLDLKELIVVVKNTNGFINLSNLEAKNEITFKTLANIQKDLAFIIPQEVSLNNNFSIQKYKIFNELYLEIRDNQEVIKLAKKYNIPLIANVKITYPYEKYPEFIEKFNKIENKKIILNDEFYSGTYLKTDYGYFPKEAIVNNQKLIRSIKKVDVNNYFPKLKRGYRHIKKELFQKLYKLDKKDYIFSIRLNKKQEMNFFGYYYILKQLKNKLGDKIEFVYDKYGDNNFIFKLIIDEEIPSYWDYIRKNLNIPMSLPRIKLLDKNINLEKLNKKFKYKFYLKKTVINRFYNSYESNELYHKFLEEYKIQENKKKPKYFVCYTGIFLDNDESLNLSFYLRNLKSQDIFEQKIHKIPYKANFSLKMQISNFAQDILYIEKISKESEFLELCFVSNK